MVYYSKYYVLLWFTTVKHSVFAEFTTLYYSKYYGLL